MARRAKRGRFKQSTVAMPMPTDVTSLPRLRLDGEPARPFMHLDPGQRVTVEVTGTVRQVGLDKRMEPTYGKDGKPGAPRKKERPEVEIEVTGCEVLDRGPKKGRH